MQMTLTDYLFKPNFVEINGIRMHFIDEGNKLSPTVLLLHGVPAWSYSYRKIIPICLENGFRIIAPDLPGFGKSDKPRTKELFSMENLVDWMESFIQKLNCSKIFLFGQDWGAIIAMILAARNPDHYSGIIACNGLLPVPRHNLPFSFRMWKGFVRHSPYIPISLFVNLGCKRRLSRAERKGYNLPYSCETEKTAIRQIPQLITQWNENDLTLKYAAYWDQISCLNIPFSTVFSSNDPITGGGEIILQSKIPGAKNQPHRILEGKHFLQEDQPEELATFICDFIHRNL